MSISDGFTKFGPNIALAFILFYFNKKKNYSFILWVLVNVYNRVREKNRKIPVCQQQPRVDQLKSLSLPVNIIMFRSPMSINKFLFIEQLTEIFKEKG